MVKQLRKKVIKLVKIVICRIRNILDVCIIRQLFLLKLLHNFLY